MRRPRSLVPIYTIDICMAAAGIAALLYFLLDVRKDWLVWTMLLLIGISVLNGFYAISRVLLWLFSKEGP